MSIVSKRPRFLAGALFISLLGVSATASAQVAPDHFEGSSEATRNDILSNATTIQTDFGELLTLDRVGDLDYFKIEHLREGGYLYINGNSPDGLSANRMKLVDANGNVLRGCDTISGDCEDLDFLNFQVPAISDPSGELTVYLVYTDTDDVAYAGATKAIEYFASIVYEPPTGDDQFEQNNTRQTARAITVPPDFTASGLTLPVGDLDYFKVSSATAGTTLRVGGNGPSGPPLFVVMDSAGVVLSDSSNPGSNPTIALPAAGDYYIAVSSPDDLALQGSTRNLSYLMSVSLDVPAAPQPTVVAGYPFEFVAPGFLGAGVTTDAEHAAVYMLGRSPTWNLVSLNGNTLATLSQGVNGPPADTDGFYPYIATDLKFRAGFGGSDVFSANAYGQVVGFIANGGLQPGNVFAQTNGVQGTFDVGLAFAPDALYVSSSPGNPTNVVAIQRVEPTGVVTTFMDSTKLTGGPTTLALSEDRNSLYAGGFGSNGQRRIVRIDLSTKTEVQTITLPPDSSGLPPNFTVDRGTGDLYIVSSLSRIGDQLLRWNKAQSTLSVFATDVPGANDVASGPCDVPQDNNWCLFVTTEQGVMKIRGFGKDNTGPAIAASATSGVPAAVYQFGSWTNQAVTIKLNAVDEDGVQTVWYSVDDAACQPTALGTCSVYSAPFTISAPGEHTVYAFGKDKMGNFSPIGTSVVNIDKTIPTASAEPTAPYVFSAWTNENVQVTLSAADLGGSQLHNIFYGVDAPACSPTDRATCTIYSAPFTVTSEGDHVLSYFSMDEAGNASLVGTAQIRIDRTKPVVTATPTNPDQPEANGWFATAPTVVFTGVDPTSGTPGATSGVVGCDAPKLADHPGQNLLDGTCVDAAGNVGSVTFAYKYDPGNAPPVTEVTATANGQPYVLGSWTNQTVAVSLSAFDSAGIAATYYAVDNPACTPATRATNCLVYSGPFAIPAEGIHVVTSFSQDGAGNVAEAGQVSVRIDKTAPVVAAVASRPADDVGVYLSSFSVKWQGTDALSGIADCDADSIYSGPATDTGLVSGTCRDQAGNQAGASYSFRYDVPLCSTKFSGLPTGTCAVTTNAKSQADLNAWIAGPRTTNLKVNKINNHYDFNGANLNITTNCAVEFNPDARMNNVGNVTIVASKIVARNDIYTTPGRTITLRAGREIEVKPAAFVSNARVIVESPKLKYRGDVNAVTASVALCGKDIEIENSSTLRAGEVYFRALNDLEVVGDIVAATSVRMRAEDIEIAPASKIGSFLQPVVNVKIDAISELEFAGDIRATGNVRILSTEYDLRPSHSFQVTGSCTISGAAECDNHRRHDACGGNHGCTPRPIIGRCVP